MSRDISPSTITALEQDVVYPFYALELQFDGGQSLRLWTGYGILNYSGNEYYGTGNLLQIDSVEETSEIAAKGATVTLSGIPDEVISLALSEPFQGRVGKIYFGTFTKGSLQQESGNFILQENGGRIYLEDSSTGFNEIFSGYMDQMNVNEGVDTTTITLTLENKLLSLEKSRSCRYNSGYQKSIYPNDKGFDFVESLQDKEIFWGRNAS